MPTIAELLQSKHGQTLLKGLTEGRDMRQVAAQVAAEAAAEAAQRHVATLVQSVVGGQKATEQAVYKQRASKAKPVEQVQAQTKTQPKAKAPPKKDSPKISYDAEGPVIDVEWTRL